MASLPAHPGPAETRSSTLLIAKIGKTCHVSVQRSVQHETLCFVRVSPLARLKTFYLFYESDCRYETDVRFSENLQRFALCCTDVDYVALKRPSFFCTDVYYRALTIARGSPTQGTRWRPTIWTKAFTRLHFWVWKHPGTSQPNGLMCHIRSASFTRCMTRLQHVDNIWAALSPRIWIAVTTSAKKRL